MQLGGKDAVIQAAKQINPDVVAIYPYTLSKAIIQEFSKYTGNGRIGELITGKDCYKIMDKCIRASIDSRRVVGVVSMDGLVCLKEKIERVSFNMLSMVLVIIPVCCPLIYQGTLVGSKENLRQDRGRGFVILNRNLGWIQIYAENGQEAYDFLIQSIRITEEVHLPVMLIMDGVGADRISEVKIIEDDEQVREFVNKSKTEASKLNRWEVVK